MSDATNPWVRSGASPAPAPAYIPPPPPSGPVTVSAPQAGVPVPDQADRLPRRDSAAQATVWWLGVHGGAGETSLTLLAAGSRAADHAWPMPSPGLLNRVALVARTNYAGLTAAQHAAREWASGALGDAIRLEGLVLVPDQPGRLPKELRLLSQLVGGGVPHTWSLPWMSPWRFGPVDPTAELPKEFGTMFSDLSLQPTAPRT